MQKLVAEQHGIGCQVPGTQILVKPFQPADPPSGTSGGGIGRDREREFGRFSQVFFLALDLNRCSFLLSVHRIL